MAGVVIGILLFRNRSHSRLTVTHMHCWGFDLRLQCTRAHIYLRVFRQELSSFIISRSICVKLAKDMKMKPAAVIHMLSSRNFKIRSYRSPNVGGLAAVSRHLAVVHGGGGRVASASIQIYAHRERGRERVRESERERVRERESGRYCVHVCGCDTTCPIIYGELVATCISMQEPTLADGYLNHSNVTCNLAPTAMSIRIEKANASHTQRKRERLQPTPTPCMALRSRHGKTQDKRT